MPKKRSKACDNKRSCDVSSLHTFFFLVRSYIMGAA